MSTQQRDYRFRQSKGRTYHPQPVILDPGAATASSFDYVATRCIATDQSGGRVIVSPLSKQGSNSDKGKPLRFVLMRQAELANPPKLYLRKSKQRTHKLNFQRRAASFVPVESLPPATHVKLYAINEVVADKPPYADLTSQALLRILLPYPATSDLGQKIRDIYVPLVHLAMHYEELYHAALATALAFKEIRSGRLAITPVLLRHSNRSVVCLRTRIRQLDTLPDDAVLITTMLLTDTAIKYGNRGEIATHYCGLRKMIHMRGGSKGMRDNIALRAMLEYSDIVAELLAISDEGEMAEEGGDCCLADSALDRSSLQYPAHPFPPTLCSDVADLPEGFRELALSRRLSREVIRLVIVANRHAFVEGKEFNSCPTMVITFSRRFIQWSTRVTESIVCLSVIVAYMRALPFPFSAEDFNLVTRLSALAKERGVEESSPDQYHHYVWTVIMTAEACQKEPLLSAITAQLLNDLLAPTARTNVSVPDFLTDWTKLEKVLKKYLWTQDLLDRWRSLWEISLRELRTTTPRETKTRVLGS